jgi:exonuclease SbcD
MGLTLLHTADWHLGATLYGRSRDGEHAAFLSWLLETLAARQVDVLVVSGDVFDHAVPSAQSQSLYYGFIARVSRETSVRQVVVVAGNHDSAARIDAPRAILGALDVFVVGDIVGNDTSRCLCPVTGPSGKVELVVAAVPFVHEFRLGVRTTGRSKGEVLEELTGRFTDLYGGLADRAKVQWPGAQLVATGHMTCAGAEKDDDRTEIHMSRSVGAVPPEIFGKAYEYVALGHIHGAYTVDPSSRVWYAGAPVPVQFDEVGRAGHALLIQLGDSADVEVLDVPQARTLVKMVGPPEELAARLATLESGGSLGSFVYAEAIVERPVPGLLDELLAAVSKNPSESPPELLALVLTRLSAAVEAPDSVAPALRDLSAEEVFIALHRARRGADPAEDLLALFRQVVSDAHRDPDEHGSSVAARGDLDEVRL